MKTGRRSEGVLFSALTFIRKTTQGIGAFARVSSSGGGLSRGGVPRRRPTESVLRLGALLVPSQWFLWGVMLIALAY